METMLQQAPELLDASHSANERSALLLAAAGGNVHAVEFLLRHGANASLTDPEENTALHLAVGAHSVGCLQLLMAATTSLPDATARAFINKVNAFGLTALHMAVGEGSIDCCQVLIEQNLLDPSIRTVEPPFHTALDMALYGEHHEIARVLQSQMEERLALANTKSSFDG
ncbi:TPA: hypothetical protein N0F65_005167 [Lagenidium giganteum]|uniref:Uncharacterized protein n=1 Tax=Lagenidium giganteum TaxID=4803 RepID=A0AAV2YZS1_9STRA|nr:TPA: hypothetical protein N0F65_005167 [Lagenidium giganteum]